MPTTTRPHTMSPKLTDPLDGVLRPIFDVLPIHEAMTALVGENGDRADAIALIESAAAEPALADRPDLLAGLWLYVDQLDRSHTLSQSIATPTGSFWHAIMHRREGDFSNSHYWYRKVGRHPAMNKIELAGGSAGAGTTMGRYDPHAFVDAVDAAHRDHDATGAAHPELRALQRREWVALFEWCVEH